MEGDFLCSVHDREVSESYYDNNLNYNNNPSCNNNQNYNRNCNNETITKQFEILQMTTRKLNNSTWKQDAFEKILMEVELNQGFLQLQAWVSTKWSPINSFFFVTNFNVSWVIGIKDTLLSCNLSGLHSQTPRPGAVEALGEGLLQHHQAWVSTKWSPINSFIFFNNIIILSVFSIQDTVLSYNSSGLLSQAPRPGVVECLALAQHDGQYIFTVIF